MSLWYIYAIAIYYLVSPLLYQAIKKYGWTILVIVCIATYALCFVWSSSAESPYLIEKGLWVVKRFPVFVLGMAIAMKPINVRIPFLVTLGAVIVIADLLLIRYLIMAKSSAGSGIAVVDFFVAHPVCHNFFRNGKYVLDMLSVLFLIPIFSWISHLASKVRVISVIEWFGIYSLELYLCHEYIFKSITVQFTPPSRYFFLLAFTISILVAYLIKKIASFVSTLFECVIKRQ